MKRWKLWIGCSALALSAVVAIVRAQTVIALDGSFVLAATDAQQAALTSAIANATSSLPAETRDEWRAQLEEITRPAPRITLARQGLESSIVDGAGVEQKSPIDGTRVALEGDWELEQRMVGSALEQRIENDSIDQVYRYTVSADSRTLSVDVSITAAFLSRPIAYRLSYTRQR